MLAMCCVGMNLSSPTYIFLQPPSLHRLVKEGDTVTMGDDVCNVQSDKVSCLSGMVRLTN